MCLIPGFDGAVFSREWKEALWARFRSDLVGIDAEDVRFTAAGVDVVLRGGSRDAGEGRAVVVRRGASPACA